MDIDDLLKALHGAHDLLGTSRELPKCDVCDAPNTATAAFCTACGKRLSFPCPTCGQRCVSLNRHCPACGRGLTGTEVRQSIEKLRTADQIRSSDPLRAFEELHKLAEGRTIRYRASRLGEARFLKVAEKAPSRGFLRNEAKALEGFEHTNIIRLIAHHEHRDRTVLEMEWVETEALRFPLPIGRLIKLMLPVASALAALHQRDLVHCDVKPDNILVRKSDGVPVLIDFETSQQPGKARVAGYTPMFAAPEQVFGDRVDARADVYAFGVTLYLLFFYDRLPSILDRESGTQRAFEKVLRARVKRSKYFLDHSTMIEGYTGSALPEAIEGSTIPHKLRGAASNKGEILGAKYFFAAELQRIADVNRRLDLTRDILAIIADSTEVDPDRRPADGRELVTRLSGLAAALGEDS